MSNSNRYFLQRLVTTPGAHSYPQMDLSKLMYNKLAALPGSTDILKMVGFIYDHSRIRQRHFEFEINELQGRKNWYQTVNEASFSMAVRALKNLFVENPVGPEQCDALIVVSSTHNGFPGLSRKLQDRFGFRLDTLCYDLAAFGCAGAPPAIHLAQMLLETGRCRTVCLLAVEALGSHSHSRTHIKPPTMSELVGHAIVSDASVALILSKEPGDKPCFSYRSCQMTQRFWPKSLDLNVLSACDENEPYISVGKEIQTRLVGELSHLVTEDVLAKPIFLHPGGIALMRQVTDKFPQLSKATALAIADLEDYGNLGSTSVLWVFSRALKQQETITPDFRLVTFGPGKVTSILLMEGVETH
jgi:alkylresorcinol/alkylpyrone synthase